MKSLMANIAVLGSTLVFLAAGSGSLSAQGGKAADDAAAAAKFAAPVIERELIPGADKMTGDQRDTYRRRMEAATTPEDKARIRAEYAKAAEAPVPDRPAVGDPVRGASLHSGCFGCHGIERYVAPVTYLAASLLDSVLRASGLSELQPAEPARFKGRASSLAQLRAGVIRRNEFLNPKMTPQEIEDVVAYLNASYYKFPQ